MSTPNQEPTVTEDERGHHIIDLDEIARVLTADGMPAEAYRSGGTCATVGVGQMNAEGDYPILIGPGWVALEDSRERYYATAEELFVGPGDEFSLVPVITIDPATSTPHADVLVAARSTWAKVHATESDAGERGVTP